MLNYLNCKAIADTVDVKTSSVLKRIKADSSYKPILMLWNDRDLREDDKIFCNLLKKSAEKFGIWVIDTTDARLIPIIDGIIPFGDISNIPSEYSSALTPNLLIDGGEKSCYDRAVVVSALMLVDIYNPVKDKNPVVTVIGRSEYIGKRIASLLLNEDKTVMVAHSKTDFETLNKMISIFDIVVSAAHPSVNLDGVKINNNQLIIDIGNNFNLINTNNEDSVVSITPKKDGIGLITRAILMKRVIANYARRMEEIFA